MSTKNIVIGAAILLAVLIGGYFAYTSFSNPASENLENSASDQVQAQEVAVGTGEIAEPGDTVAVLYVGQLEDGTIFDSSAAHDNQPLVFVLGEDGIIAGFQIGVNGMRVGGERLLAIPPALGYGEADVRQDPNDPVSAVIIPGNSTLVFDVKLVQVQKAETATAQ
jgi:FKBP-type peptidyl-prolyl cis-trans isomerase